MQKPIATPEQELDPMPAATPSVSTEPSRQPSARPSDPTSESQDTTDGPRANMQIQDQGTDRSIPSALSLDGTGLMNGLLSLESHKHVTWHPSERDDEAFDGRVRIQLLGFDGDFISPYITPQKLEVPIKRVLDVKIMEEWIDWMELVGVDEEVPAAAAYWKEVDLNGKPELGLQLLDWVAQGFELALRYAHMVAQKAPQIRKVIGADDPVVVLYYPPAFHTPEKEGFSLGKFDADNFFPVNGPFFAGRYNPLSKEDQDHFRETYTGSRMPDLTFAGGDSEKGGVETVMKDGEVVEKVVETEGVVYCCFIGL
ncbi:hypothetical protein BJ508DRAFT_314369 [Ascobolus immersus RN42]|uniref:Uncharacterized protein n=1 Tax=Ascobolus immersus RN42 TaxID=1160509 RepID=A0A3N4HFB6_ASCIM|nr:hypothetical protein BJ508DRAFT_314369 [Ascobolus immersus RN42]